MTHMHYPALGLVEPHAIVLSPLILKAKAETGFSFLEGVQGPRLPALCRASWLYV